MLTSCLPATGVDNWTIMLLVVIAGVLLAAGVIAVKKSGGRVALAIAPLAILGLVIAAPAAPAQALETAIPSFSFSDTWTPNEPEFDYFQSEDAAGQALADMGTLEDMVTEGTATRTTTLTVSSSPDPADTYTFQVPPWSFDDFDFSVRVTGTGPNSVETAADLLDDFTDLTMVLTFTYDYVDSCDRSLQTVVTYTGTVGFPQVVG